MNRTTPVCTQCSLPMTRTDIGTVVVSMYLNPPEPHKILLTNSYRCQLCNCSITEGYGEPTSEHDSRFDQYLMEIMTELGKPYGLSNNGIVVEYEKLAHAIQYGTGTMSRAYLLEVLRKYFDKRNK